MLLFGVIFGDHLLNCITTVTLSVLARVHVQYNSHLDITLLSPLHAPDTVMVEKLWKLAKRNNKKKYIKKSLHLPKHMEF